MSGVAYLHDLRIVHGDIKGVSSTPLTSLLLHRQVKQANVLVDNMGAARLADFGLMTMADLSTTLLSESVISSGGTFCWMSPTSGSTALRFQRLSNPRIGLLCAWNGDVRGGLTVLIAMDPHSPIPGSD